MIALLGSKAMRRAALWGAALALVVAGVWWLRADAKGDVRAEIEAAAKDSRIKTLEQTNERRNEVEKMDDDALRDALYQRLRQSGGPR